MQLEPIPVLPDPTAVPFPVGPSEFELRLPVFEGPLQLLLHLIESRQLDVLTVPLTEVADAYVAHLDRNPVDTGNLSEFVAVAAQLILLKSRRLLPSEPLPALRADGDEPDEEDLRRRLVEYRALRDAALALGERDGASPAYRREPREGDLPEARLEPLPAGLLAAALDRLAATPEPEAPPAEVVAREVTIGQQIEMLRDLLSRSGHLILQSILAACRSRTEATVTLLAALELVRRRQARAEQSALFGPILIKAPTEPRR